MKKLLNKLFICLALPIVLVKAPFLHEQNKEKPSTEKDSTSLSDKNETINEDKKEDAAADQDETPKEEDLEGVYRMLDFDRRLILKVGVQDDYMCSVFSLAYARAILDSDYEADPYDYWEDEAVWRLADFDDIAFSDPLLTVLQRAYDEIDEGRPTLFYTSGQYARSVIDPDQTRTSQEHFVLIIGYRADADYKDLKPSDFYCADASAGYGDVPWVILTDEAPETMSGEYALYASNDKTKHVKTCLAYADTARWDADESAVIYPNYYKKES